MSQTSGEKSITKVWKIPKACPGDFYILRTERCDGCLSLTIIENKDLAWKGNVTPDIIKDVCCDKGTDMESLSRDLDNIFSSHDDNCFSLDDSKFVVKKIDRNSGIKVIIYQFQLQQTSIVPTLLSLLNNALDETDELKNTNNTLLSKVHNLERESSDLKIIIKGLAEEKDVLEETLYCKFLKILNAKKQKIAELEGNAPFSSKVTPKETGDDSDSTVSDIASVSEMVLESDDKDVKPSNSKVQTGQEIHTSDQTSASSHNTSSKQSLRKKVKLEAKHSSSSGTVHQQFGEGTHSDSDSTSSNATSPSLCGVEFKFDEQSTKPHSSKASSKLDITASSPQASEVSSERILPKRNPRKR